MLIIILLLTVQLTGLLQNLTNLVVKPHDIIFNYIYNTWLAMCLLSMLE